MPHTPLDDGPPWFGTPDRKRRPLFADPPASPLPGAMYVDLYGGTGIDSDGDECQAPFMAHWRNDHPDEPSAPGRVRGQVFHTYLRAWVSRHQRSGGRVFLLPGFTEVPRPLDPAAGWGWEPWREWLRELESSQIPG